MSQRNAMRATDLWTWRLDCGSNIDWKFNMPENSKICPALADLMADCNESFWRKTALPQAAMEHSFNSEIINKYVFYHRSSRPKVKGITKWGKCCIHYYHGVNTFQENIELYVCYSLGQTLKVT